MNDHKENLYKSVYCENPECRVTLYELIAKADTSKNTSGSTNCPGCGQYGRTKGK